MFFTKEPELYYVVYLIKDKEENPNNEVNIFQYNTYIQENEQATFALKHVSSVCADAIHLNRYDDNVIYYPCIKTREKAEKIKLQLENKFLKERVDDLEEGMRNIETRLSRLSNVEIEELKLIQEKMKKNLSDNAKIKKLVAELTEKFNKKGEK